MAQTKRRSNPTNRKPKPGDIVRATMDFVGRRTPPPPVNVWNTAPDPQIFRDTVGILQGPAAGAPDLYDVAFETDDGKTIRVEARPDQIELP